MSLKLVVEVEGVRFVVGCGVVVIYLFIYLFFVGLVVGEFP